MLSYTYKAKAGLPVFMQVSLEKSIDIIYERHFKSASALAARNVFLIFRRLNLACYAFFGFFFVDLYFLILLKVIMFQI